MCCLFVCRVVVFVWSLQPSVLFFVFCLVALFDLCVFVCVAFVALVALLFIYCLDNIAWLGGLLCVVVR
jgi:hypothetical protein